MDGLARTEVVGFRRDRAKQVDMNGLTPIFTTAEHGLNVPNESVEKGAMC